MSATETAAATNGRAEHDAAGPRRFVGKRAIVTGASDRGIGGAIAERLAGEGARVRLLSRSRPEKLLKRLSFNAAEVQWSACDVQSSREVRAAVEQCAASLEGIDVVVNNAGVEQAQRFDAVSDGEWERLIDVNLTGAVRVTRAALAHLASPGGVIVNVASALALGGCPGFGAYSAAKAGLVAATQSLALELAPRGMRAVCVAPALVHTPMTHKHAARFGLAGWSELEAAQPLGIGSPHDVAAAVAFLASYEARWITGVTLPLGWVSSYRLPTERMMDALGDEG